VPIDYEHVVAQRGATRVRSDATKTDRFRSSSLHSAHTGASLVAQQPARCWLLGQSGFVDTYAVAAWAMLMAMAKRM
jgi:hypothetical protein